MTALYEHFADNLIIHKLAVRRRYKYMRVHIHTLVKYCRRARFSLSLSLFVATARDFRDAEIRVSDRSSFGIYVIATVSRTLFSNYAEIAVLLLVGSLFIVSSDSEYIAERYDASSELHNFIVYAFL